MTFRRECSCDRLVPGLDAVRRACEGAAYGPNWLREFVFCPWCGGRIRKAIRVAPATEGPSLSRRLLHLFRHEWSPWETRTERHVWTLLGTLDHLDFESRKCALCGETEDNPVFD